MKTVYFLNAWKQFPPKINSVETVFMENHGGCAPKAFNNYTFLERIGNGSFSKVYRVVHTVSHKQYACKVFPKTNLDQTVDVTHFQREINVMALMEHPNIVQLHDFFWDEANFYLILDYCVGGELFDFIIANDQLSEPVAAYLFKQIAYAVQFCHSRGLAHRDIKPENILVGEFPNVKISDFGLCGFVSCKELMDSFCGSPCYCSPECICQIKYDGKKSDIWSLGIVLYALVTGEHPWYVMNTPLMLQQITSGTYEMPTYISKELEDLISKMIRVDPNERLTIDQVVAHPWLEVASQAPFPKLHLDCLPGLYDNKIKLEDLSKNIENYSKASDSGVISPLDYINNRRRLTLGDQVIYCQGLKFKSFQGLRIDKKQMKSIPYKAKKFTLCQHNKFTGRRLSYEK